MRELPRGTVTFLFTDIEGSTRLLEQLGTEAYAQALADHRQVIRTACSAQGGVEVDTEGDALFVAFPTAQGALAAAAAFTEGLAEGPIRVRVGLHTGTPLVAEDNYVGIDVHRAARIAAAGHGGQVLVSSTTAALTGSEGLRDLGEHRFKDLAAPERVYQLGEGEFPRLKTLYQTNLPVPATPFVGRERELAEASDLLLEDGVRLLTLSGPGGTGKTRLALQAAAAAGDDYPDGVWWVSLASLADPSLVLPTAGEALGAKRDLADEIGGKRLLLLLDNFEHLIEAAGEVGALLGACPELTVLVTSRERLQLAGEHEYPVPVLAAPDGLELFSARARALGTEIDGDHAARELCERLDNLPLALELAAARTKLFSPAQLLERLGHRLDLFKGGRDADPRQRTLRATIEWSHDLLTPEEQRLFARLSVFAGGCAYEAAEEICDADEDTLQSLIDKSLLRRGDGPVGEARFWMLETIRQFAAERFDELGEGEEVRRRHASFFAVEAETADPHMRGGPEQSFWVERIDAEYDNLRVAMRWALRNEPEIAVRLVASLDWFFWVRGRLIEGTAWLDQALASEGARDPRLRARALQAAAVVADRHGDVAAQTRYADECFALYSELGDEAGIASALREQGKAAVATGNNERAATLYEECIVVAQRAGDIFDEAVARNNLGDIALREQRWERAIELCSESRSLRLDFGDRWGAALTLFNVAFAELHLGRRDEAERDLRQALREAMEIGSIQVVTVCLGCLAAAAWGAGHASKAARLIGAETAIREENGMVLDGAEIVLQERTAASASTALGAEVFEKELQRGRRLSLHDAVAYALVDADARTLDEHDGASVSVD